MARLVLFIVGLSCNKPHKDGYESIIQRLKREMSLLRLPNGFRCNLEIAGAKLLGNARDSISCRFLPYCAHKLSLIRTWRAKGLDPPDWQT